eukprot:TRINITY_DN20004_c0_g1_i1.p1 TRINITY_DN20004_c0_g1~~TRINITY_DN20004_c0_g1_i1.p1  ORF type:complete len:784 (-),score=151.97 TRINITY_DN20004_c0_g1_i1:179-2530(-)
MATLVSGCGTARPWTLHGPTAARSEGTAAVHIDAAAPSRGGSSSQTRGAAASLAAVLTSLASHASGLVPRQRRRFKCCFSGRVDVLHTSGGSQSSETRSRRRAVHPGEKVVGIDLGTTNSAVAAVEAGVPVIVPSVEGERTTPSVVAFDKEGKLLVGITAKRQAALNPLNTFSSVKRWFGRSYNEVVDEAKLVPYNLVDADGKLKLDCPATGKQLAPEEISAHVLRKLRQDAMDFLNASVEQAVITVPAYFDDAQRQATKTAGKLAGLKVLRICNEPTMAALAYGLDTKNASKLIVIDLGGGTFDVSVLEVGDRVCEVLATTGDTHLGGDDFDRKILNWLADGFEMKHGIDLRLDKQALQRMAEASEKAKIELSSLEEVRVAVPFVAANESGPLHIDEVLSRELFEELCDDLLNRLAQPVHQAFEDAKVSAKLISEVVLIGGSSRIPAVKALAQELTCHRSFNNAISPDEVVAIGSSVQAAMIAGEVKDIMLIDVTPLTLGVETDGGVFTPIMERGSAIPWKAVKVFTTSADAQDEIEVVILQGERPLAKDNKRLGMFRLRGIPPAPAGVPKIEVAFDINLDGILTVTAKDRATRKQTMLVIEEASTLDDEEVQRILDEAEDQMEKDEDEKDKLELRYAASCLVKQTQQNLKDLSHRTPIDVQIAVKAKLRELQATIKDDEKDIDYSAMGTALEVLRFELMKMGQVIYGKQVGPQDSPGPARPRPPGGVAGGGMRDEGPKQEEKKEEEEFDEEKDWEENVAKWVKLRRERLKPTDRVKPTVSS